MKTFPKFPENIEKNCLRISPDQIALNLARKIADETCSRINEQAFRLPIETQYKTQLILEELIKILQERV